MKDSLNIAIAGATGYVGLELVKILSKHSKAKILYLCASKSIGKKIYDFDKKITKRNFPKISNIKNNNLIIKIDVEGHERQVLEGMERTLSQNSVLLQIEIFDENFENINNFLLKQRFHFLMKISSDHYYKKL